VLLGEIALQAGDAAGARQHWERAAELIEPRLSGSRDWRLLDPAARAAARLGHVDMAEAIIVQLKQFGYVPLEPWPEVNRLDSSKP